MPYQKVDHPWTIERIYSYFPRLSQRDDQKGRNLSGGEQQMLAIARTLMGNPEMLLVDEPTEGLAPSMVEMVIQILRGLNEEGYSILIVEHAIDVALSLASRAYIMFKGKMAFQGTKEELYADEEIKNKYLKVF
jgi:branched-chain amino acid transport system ATP-binding protein